MAEGCEETQWRTFDLSEGKAAPRDWHGICTNKVITSKYTALDFVPKNLWEQLHKLGNVYFLLISFVMWVGEKQTYFVGPMKAFSTYSVLFMMMSLTAIMALIDDRRRAAADKEINNKRVRLVLDAKATERSKTWEQVEVGDALVVRQDEEMPADMVIVYASGEGGNCHVSTANLDGETNLKQKCASTLSQAALTKSGVTEAAVLQRFDALEGVIKAELPTTSIHTFNGNLMLYGGASDDPLNGKNLLLRGTVLRNTEWCLGVVVYTGAQTRMVMNSRPAPLKRSTVERITNKAMVCILATQALLAVVSDILFMLHRDEFRSYWYLIPPNIILPDIIGYWLTFFVLYSNLMPISLYPTMEAINAAQAYFIKNDKKMFYAEPDNPFAAGVRSTNLCQEIGQVSHIFSDKTGTLTQNVMELKRLSIAGRIYGEYPCAKGFSAINEVLEARSREPTRQATDDFLEVLAVGHTVMVARDRAGNIRYEAESPDENALVSATADFGWAFQGRTGQQSVVAVSSGGRQDQRSYNVLAVNAFDSTRKRMSVLVDTGREVVLLAKGADTVMLERADRQSRHPRLDSDLRLFARQGLRTLVLGRRTLDRQQAADFMREYEAAQRSQDRDNLMALAAEKVERDLQIVGVTAIEDKLQDGVDETIAAIKEAGIGLWVLTGDKLETAETIGYSTKMLSTDMLVEKLPPHEDSSIDDIGHLMEKAFARIQGVKSKDTRKSAGLMITGDALREVTAQQLEEQLLELTQLCEVVIACRVSPIQKAEMVRLVRTSEPGSPPVTLSIGDGANDVPMIQEAQVGVGIAGKEGRQAVNNSDFAIGQFKYLKRLLLLHGRWNYRRACKCTLFTFWRNAVQVLMISYYTFANGYSGTSLFEDGIRITFNPLCSLPIVMTGIFDQDVSEQISLRHPQLYQIGMKNKDLDLKMTSITLLAAFIHSIILLWVTFFAFPAMDLKNCGDYYTFGTAVYSCLMLDMSYRVLFLNATHNWYTVGSVVLSLICYLLTLLVYPGTRFFSDLLEPNMYGVTANMFSQPIFWVCIFAVPVLAMSMDLLVTYLFHRWNPDDRDKIEDWDHAVPRSGSDDLDDRPVSDMHPFFTCCDDEWTVVNSDEETNGIDPSPYISEWCVAQQQVKYMRRRITKHFVIGILFAGGLGLVIVGRILLWFSEAASQVRIHYYEPPEEKRNYWIRDLDPLGTREEEVFRFDYERGNCWERSQGGEPYNCTVEIDIPEDMKPPILVYYAVGNVYQNFNDYLKSEVVKELYGETVDPRIREVKCKGSTRIDADGNDIYPCGMMATSVFNDTFSIDELEISQEGISWKEDVERYHNPPDYGERSDTTWLYDLYPEVIPRDEGVRNEHFVSWMRPSASWRIWNQYGWVHEELQANQKLTVRISSNYPTERLGAYKHLVLTEVNSFGGRHSLIGLALLLSGILCLLSMLFVCCLPAVARRGRGHSRTAQG